MQWTWCGRGGGARPLEGARGRFGAIDGFCFWHAGAWFPPFARTRAAPGRRQPPARCTTGFGASGWGERRRSRPAPWRYWGQRRARESSGLFGRSRRAADEASIWQPSGSIKTVESRCLTLARLAGVRGVAGAWVSASGLIRREAAKRLPRPRKCLLGGRPPPVFFSLGSRDQTPEYFGWLFRPLCVTTAYGLRMDRLGASGGFYIVHNVHLLMLKFGRNS